MSRSSAVTPGVGIGSRLSQAALRAALEIGSMRRPRFARLRKWDCPARKHMRTGSTLYYSDRFDSDNSAALLSFGLRIRSSPLMPSAAAIGFAVGRCLRTVCSGAAAMPSGVPGSARTDSPASCATEGLSSCRGGTGRRRLVLLFGTVTIGARLGRYDPASACPWSERSPTQKEPVPVAETSSLPADHKESKAAALHWWLPRQSSLPESHNY